MATIDVKSLGRPGQWGGEEERWEEWSFQMKSYLGCIHASAPGLLATAERHAGPIYQAELADDHQRGISAAISHALTICMRGP